MLTCALAGIRPCGSQVTGKSGTNPPDQPRRATKTRRRYRRGLPGRLLRAWDARLLPGQPGEQQERPERLEMGPGTALEERRRPAFLFPPEQAAWIPLRRPRSQARIS